MFVVVCISTDDGTPYVEVYGPFENHQDAVDNMGEANRVGHCDGIHQVRTLRKVSK